jgi:hypothetical protein
LDCTEVSRRTMQNAALINKKNEISEAVGSYLLLTKPTIMLLVVLSGAVALFIEGSLLYSPIKCCAILLAVYLTGGCANALNQFFEREIDAKMARTQKRRPLPQGKIQPTHALIFIVAIGVVGVLIFGLMFNWLSAMLSLGTILFYGFFYTLWLKPNTPQNIVIGGGSRCNGTDWRMGRHYGRNRPRTDSRFSHRLSLDTAALLGSRTLLQRGLHQSRIADDARRERRERNAQTNVRLHDTHRAGKPLARRDSQGLDLRCCLCASGRNVYQTKLGNLAELFGAIGKKTLFLFNYLSLRLICRSDFG